jgi:hypothetical protein
VGEVVNLRRARKVRDRRRDEAQADQNRISYGLSKAERQLSAKTRDQAEKRLDGHMRDGGDTPEKPDSAS